MIRIVLVDDHTIVRHMMCDTLTAQNDFEVIADYSTGEELLDRIGTLQADIVIMDVGLPDDDGIETTRKLRQQSVETPILFLTMHLNEAIMKRTFDAGGNGYAVKHEPFEVLADGIRRVAAGATFKSPMILSRGREMSDEIALLDKLSSREREIVSLVASGWTATEIADHLSISGRTVDYHRRNIAEKTGLRRIADIAKFAIAVGIRSDQ